MPALRLYHHPPSVTPADHREACHREACAFPDAPETGVGTGRALGVDALGHAGTPTARLLEL